MPLLFWLQQFSLLKSPGEVGQFEQCLFQRAEFPTPPALNNLQLKTSIFYSCDAKQLLNPLTFYTDERIERRCADLRTLFLHGFPLIAAQWSLQSQQQSVPAFNAYK